jgi:hypothetical protein
MGLAVQDHKSRVAIDLFLKNCDNTYMARKKKDDTLMESKGAKSQVSERLEKALLYKSLLDKCFLDPNESNDAVNKEIHDFIQEKLEILLGMKPEPVAEKNHQLQLQKFADLCSKNFIEIKDLIKSIGFEENEKVALKALATAVMNKNKDSTITEEPVPKQEIPDLRKRIIRKVISAEGKEIEMDVTGQVIPKSDPDGLPMATDLQMATLAANHIELVQGKSTTTASALMNMLSSGVVHNDQEGIEE